MTMDQEARAVMQQLVKALAPLNYPALTPDQKALPDGERVWPAATVTLGQAKAAVAAIAAGNAALAATAS